MAQPIRRPGEKIEYRRGAREEARRLKGLVDMGVDPTEQAKRATSEGGRAERRRQEQE